MKLEDPGLVGSHMAAVSLGPGRFLGRETGSVSFGPLRITETAYAAGEDLPAHEHKWPYLCFVLSGSYEEQSPAAVAECSGGMVAYGPADLPHRNTFGDSGGACLNVALDPAWLGDGPTELPERKTLLYADEPAATFFAFQLRQELRWPDSLSEYTVEGLARALVARLGRWHAGEARETGPDWLEAAVTIASAEFATPIRLAQIAHRVGVHPTHLARAFRARTGSSVGEYLRQKRVEAARRLLDRSDVPIATVACECGFADQSHLTRVFRSRTGLTPGAYRRLALRPS